MVVRLNPFPPAPPPPHFIPPPHPRISFGSVLAHTRYILPHYYKEETLGLPVYFLAHGFLLLEKSLFPKDGKSRFDSCLPSKCIKSPSSLKRKSQIQLTAFWFCFISKENKAWHFMWIVCPSRRLTRKSKSYFLINEFRLLEFCLAV